MNEIMNVQQVFVDSLDYMVTNNYYAIDMDSEDVVQKSF